MKQYLFVALALIAFSSCSNDAATSKTPPVRQPTTPDQLIAADSIPIMDSRFGEQKYGIKLLTTTKSDSGEYKLIANYGYITDSMTTRLPYLNQELRVALRRDEEQPYGYIVGFYMEEDSFKIFHDYISATASRNYTSNLTTQSELKFSYLKAYYLK